MRCDFRGLIPPEMDKVRWVVVLSPKHLNRYRLAAVVPISTTAPDHESPWHVKLDKDPAPNGKDGAVVWAKCDMIMSVSYERLSGWWDGKVNGRRNYVKVHVSEDELRRVKRGVLYSLGLGGLGPQIQ